MEMKVPGTGDAARGKKRPPSRLQKQAPASLQLEQGGGGAGAGAGPGPAAAWGDGGAPIPLLSPLVAPPTLPLWEADQAGPAGSRRAEGAGVDLHPQQQRGASRHAGERQAHDVSPKAPAPAAGAGWRHPALPAPVAEPASLVPFFQSQCAVEVRHAQQ